MRTNVHTHTIFSDGRNAPEKMVLAAIRCGLSAIGFSDHAYSPFDEGSVSPIKEGIYRTEIRRLREKYADRIEVALGYEHDATYPLANRNEYDYIIESVHFLTKDGVTMPIDYSEERFGEMLETLFGGDFRALHRAYADEICRSLRENDGIIVGHIGLTTKYNGRFHRFDEEGQDYLSPMKDAIAYAVECDRIVEVNTGAISRGWRRQPYPGRTLLKTLSELGGRIAITGDSHSASALTCAFDEAYALAASCGFSEVWQWKNGEFVPEGL